MTRLDPADEYRSAVERLLELADDVTRERSQREVLDAIADVRVAVARAYHGRRPQSTGTGGARNRILTYLQRHLGEWVTNDEIAAVSGIGEWARRIRELRLEQGYEIEEGGGRYRLTAEAPNFIRRDRWRTVTELRNAGGDAVDRVQELFETFIGEALTLEEIDRVAHGKDGARLARKLREAQLLPVETSADAPDLGAGEHRLVSAYERDRLHPSQVMFGEDLRRQVFGRDRFTCWTCSTCRSGRSADGVFYLVVRHLDASPEALPGLPVERVHDLGRLATSCNRCAGRG